MRYLHLCLASATAAGLAAMLFSGSVPAAAQTSYPGTGSAAPAAQAPANSAPAASEPAPNQAEHANAGTPAESAPSAAPAAKTYTVPAGAKVLLQLRSAVDTRSAKPGDAVYLASTFPVVVGDRVLIPAGVYVQGVIDRVARAGRVRGRAQLDMHFTSIIFPNGSVVEIPGLVEGLPGAKDQS